MTTSDNEWQPVVQRVVQRVTTNENEWQTVVISANFPFFRKREKHITKHPKKNSLNFELFRIKISTEELLFWSRYFSTGSTFSEKLHLEKDNFSEKYYSALPTFLKEATFYGSWLFRRATFYNILFQKSYYFMATIPFHSYISYLSVFN